jgi:hypothetical protein
MRLFHHSRTALNNLESGSLKEVHDRLLGKPAEVGAIQQPSILVLKIAHVQANLDTPVLRIWNARYDRSVRVQRAANSSKNTPRVNEVFKDICKNPARGREQRAEDIVADLLNIGYDHPCAPSASNLRVIGINLYSYVFA